MGRSDTPGLTFDAGALIAFEGCDRRVNALVQRAKDLGRRIVIPAGVLGQVWRNGAKKARLSRLLSAPNVLVEELSRIRAQKAGELCARSRSKDVVDASVVIAAWKNGRIVVTSDAGDLRRLDPTLHLVEV